MIQHEIPISWVGWTLSDIANCCSFLRWAKTWYREFGFRFYFAHLFAVFCFDLKLILHNRSFRHVFQIDLRIPSHTHSYNVHVIAYAIHVVHRKGQVYKSNKQKTDTQTLLIELHTNLCRPKQTWSDTQNKWNYYGKCTIVSLSTDFYTTKRIKSVDVDICVDVVEFVRASVIVSSIRAYHTKLWINFGSWVKGRLKQYVWHTYTYKLTDYYDLFRFSIQSNFESMQLNRNCLAQSNRRMFQMCVKMGIKIPCVVRKFIEIEHKLMYSLCLLFLLALSFFFSSRMTHDHFHQRNSIHF